MTKLEFKGPYTFQTGTPTIDAIPAGINGVSIWCVQTDDEVFRVHYVGEGGDVRNRLRDHLRNLGKRNYRAFGPDMLKRNVMILMHREGQGMIKRFSALDAKQFLQRYIDSMHLFYAEIPGGADAPLRTRYEVAIAREIQDYGQNILDARGMRVGPPGNLQVSVDTGRACIEALWGAVLQV